MRVLVAADIHLGIEHEIWLGGASIPSQTQGLLQRLAGSVMDIQPQKLVLLGDIKHNVPRTSWQERSEVPSFLKRLGEMVEVEVVPGNHDGGLAELLPPGLKMHPPAGFVLDGVGYFHGHTWPHPSLLKAEELVAGHIHPSIRLSDPLGVSWNEQVWVRTTTSKEAVHLQYREEMPTPGLIILPAFNPLSGSLPLNTSGETDRGPILRLAELALARMYLLDGTDLGDLKSIGTKRTRPRRSRTEGYIEDKEGRQRHE